MQLFYETRGIGEPLLLIPGFASGAWTWFKQTQDLAKDFRVIIFDPRGIGRSAASKEELQNLSLEVFANDIRQIFDELKIEKANVLGASFGGFVAQQFALQFPEKIDKLILACTSAGGVGHIKPDLEILNSFTPDPSLSVGERIRKFIRPAFTKAFNETFADEVEIVCRLREQNAVDDSVYISQLQTAFSFDTSDKLSEIKNETLVLTGDKDSVVPMENSLNLAEKIPNAKLEIIENGSHMFFVENADRFNLAVRNFLKK